MSGATPIPQAFLERMSRYLGPEYEAFARCLDEPARTGLRVNTLKTSPEELKRASALSLGERVQWCPSAFRGEKPKPLSLLPLVTAFGFCKTW